MADHTKPYSGPIVTRAGAKAAGVKKFFTNVPCAQAHIAQRYVSNGMCVSCQRMAHGAWKAANPGKAEAATEAWKEANPGAASAATRRWQKANPDKLREYETRRDKVKRRANQRRARKRNPAKFSAKRAAWGKKNGDHLRTYHVGYRALNPAKIKAMATARRAREASAEGAHTGEEVLALFARQNGRCAYCETTIVMAANRPDTATEDHILALVNGGSNSIENIALACKPCNSRKGIKDAADFVREMIALKAHRTRVAGGRAFVDEGVAPGIGAGRVVVPASHPLPVIEHRNQLDPLIGPRQVLAELIERDIGLRY